jgi:hypothetical protein
MESVYRLPLAFSQLLLQDAEQRDLVTARRSALVRLLLSENFLTRAQLIVRVEMRLGRDCFGVNARHDTFYRDMRFVKQAFSLTGSVLRYSRRKGQRGYYQPGRGRLDQDTAAAIRGALAELDGQQLTIFKGLTLVQKFAAAASVIDFSRRVSRGMRETS